MAFVVVFDHLSLQMGNLEPKQERKLAVEVRLSGKYVITVQRYQLELVSARPLFIMRALSTGDRNQTLFDRGNGFLLQHHRRPDSAKRLSMGSCLREERQFVKGKWLQTSIEPLFLQNKLCPLTSDFMIDESSVLNKNLSLIVVDERYTVETCQNTVTFNLTFILQILSLLSFPVALFAGLLWSVAH